jgi:hypothetical protein
VIRVANGQGFWGDWLEAPVRLIEQGPIDYLTLDYLAEVTMSILQKQKKEDANLGYARDFPPLVARLEKRLKERGVRVVANAGGVNVAACAREVRRLAPSLQVAVVEGDDIFPRVGELIDKGHEFRNLDTGEEISAVRNDLLSANAYLGAFPLADALRLGADVVVCGRCADAALALAPMIHAFGWREHDWNVLAAGVAAGHIIECGAQTTGGNSQVGWQDMPDPAHIGYPIVEMDPNGEFTVTKHPGTGGRVNTHIVKEQLVYEIGDPRAYLTPDVAADFTTLRLRDDGEDRVRVCGATGAPRPEKLKVSMSYHWGWKAAGTLVFPGPEARRKTQIADAIVRRRLQDLGLALDKVHSETIGDDALAQLRMAARSKDRKAIDRFTREMIPLVLSGPPGATGYGEGRPPVREVVAYWPALLSREEVTPAVREVV